MSYKILCVFWLTLSVVSAFAITAFAEDYGYYDCKPERAYIWGRGQLTANAALQKLGISFQQRTIDAGVLATGMKAPWAQQKLQITHKSDDGTDLVASGTVTNKYGAVTTIIRIGAGDKSDLRFILLGDGFDGVIYSGHCKFIPKSDQ
jgi:hypothetical protein